MRECRVAQERGFSTTPASWKSSSRRVIVARPFVNWRNIAITLKMPGAGVLSVTSDNVSCGVRGNRILPHGVYVNRYQ